MYVDGYDIKSNISEAFQAMGYCPQHNALWDDVTLQEHLQVYALVAGVPKQQVDFISK